MKLIKIAAILVLLALNFPSLTYASHECSIDDGCPGKSIFPLLEIPSPGFLGISLWPLLQFSKQQDDVTGLRLNVTYGVNKTISGLDLGLVNSGGSVFGLEVGVMNWIDRVYGIQVGGFNVSQEINGFQWGVLNINGITRGLQLGLLNYHEEGWFQFSIVNVASGGTFFQLAPLANVVLNDYTNIQFSAANFGNVQGAQFGAFNYAKNLTGLQFGIVNMVTEHLKGVQLGLINLSLGKGGLTFFPIINAGF